VTSQVIKHIERELSNLAQLKSPEIQAKIAKRVEELTRPAWTPQKHAVFLQSVKSF
jgi:type III restriction enzyme